MHTMSNDVLSDRPRRRHYSKEFKADVVRSCAEPGASIAAIALSHGVNANIVHRWVREHETTANEAAVQTSFLPVTLGSVNIPLSDVGDDGVIEIEFSRGASAARVRWPLQGSAACAALLRDWLR